MFNLAKLCRVIPLGTCLLSAQPPPRVAPVIVKFETLDPQFQAPAPAYPGLARMAGVQGTVDLELEIDRQGQVVDAKAMDGPGLLRATAEAYFKDWRFKPVLVDGQPTPVKCLLPIPFSLEDVPVRTGQSTPTKVVLELLHNPSATTLPVDVETLRREILESFRVGGLKEVSASEAGDMDTFKVKVELIAHEFRGDLAIGQVLLRASLWSHREAKATAAGAPTLVIHDNRVSGQVGVRGMQERLSALVRATLRPLLGIPSSATLPARKRADSTVGIPADFTFHQLKVRRQPPPPPYPSAAKEFGVQGTVTVDILVDPSGRPVVVESIGGPPELLVAAIRYALTWEFEPARLNGAPVQARFRLTMPFRLKDGHAAGVLTRP